jgi:hypothetical protein
VLLREQPIAMALLFVDVGPMGLARQSPDFGIFSPMRCVLVLLLAACATTRTLPERAQAPRRSRAERPHVAAPESPVPEQAAVTSSPVAQTVHPRSDPCQPLPHVGDPCSESELRCVISWGSPGGFSAELYCRDGRWTYEEESNLDE